MCAGFVAYAIYDEWINFLLQIDEQIHAIIETDESEPDEDDGIT